MTSLKTNWLVVGFGSDLGGDDRFGLAVAQAVRQRHPAADAGVVVYTARILGPELVEKICTAGAVIFVDASIDLAPGVIQCIRLHLHGQEETAPRSPAIAMSHHCDPLTLMQLAATLYGAHPPAWLFVVGGANFGLSENMSSAVSASVPEVIDKISRLMSESLV